MIYRYRVWQTLSGNSGSFFCPFTHLKNPPKITILKKWTTKNKNARDTILHMGTKNHNHEVQFFRYRVRGTEFFVDMCHFLPFYPLTTWKIKMLKKWKKYLEMSSFYTCVPRIRIIWCMLPEIWSVTDIIFCHFGPIFALLLH